jgi:hypothetical protein
LQLSSVSNNLRALYVSFINVASTDR